MRVGVGDYGEGGVPADEVLLSCVQCPPKTRVQPECSYNCEKGAAADRESVGTHRAEKPEEYWCGSSGATGRMSVRVERPEECRYRSSGAGQNCDTDENEDCSKWIEFPVTKIRTAKSIKSIHYVFLEDKKPQNQLFSQRTCQGRRNRVQGLRYGIRC